MRIVIITVGTWGDMQPCLALGLGLQAAHHHVRIATHAVYEPFVRSHGLEFFAVEGNPREVIESDAGRAMLRAGDNPARFLRHIAQAGDAILRRLFHDCWDACQGMQVIIFAEMALFAASHVAEKAGIPFFAAFLQPVNATREFSSAFFPASPNWLRVGRGCYNRCSHALVAQIAWQITRPLTNTLRREALQLPPLPFFGPYQRWNDQRHPVLYGYSPLVLPKPSDWGDWLHVTGYWFMPDAPAWQPPADLMDFLQAGSPPVYVGFGSMNNDNSSDVTDIVLAALAQTRRRGILVTGWGGLHQRVMPANVFAIESIPHDWLFPRTVAVVHHGGAGTTAAGLRAGIPSVIVPFFADQPFWGHRVYELGVGPGSIPRKQLSVDRLAAAIHQAATDESIRRKASDLGQRIRAEDGVTRAVEVIDNHLSQYDARSSAESGLRHGQWTASSESSAR